MFRVPQSYTAQLTAANCTPAYIASRPTAALALDDNSAVQSIFVKRRPRLTGDRVRKLNAAYHEMTRINRWAQEVYADDPLHARQYVYDDSRDNSNEIDFSGTLQPNERRELGTLTYSSDQNIAFSNDGETPT